MDIARWDPTYLTGNKVVDAQHKEPFRMVNELHATIMEDGRAEVLAATLERLAQYTIEHFRCEEQLMLDSHYPAFATHKEKHDQLTKQVKDLTQKQQAVPAGLTITLSNFLADWIRHHIKEDDLALVKYLQRQNKELAAKGRP